MQKSVVDLLNTTNTIVMRKAADTETTIEELTLWNNRKREVEAFKSALDSVMKG